MGDVFNSRNLEYEKWPGKLLYLSDVYADILAPESLLRRIFRPYVAPTLMRENGPVETRQDLLHEAAASMTKEEYGTRLAELEQRQKYVESLREKMTEVDASGRRTAELEASRYLGEFVKAFRSPRRRTESAHHGARDRQAEIDPRRREFWSLDAVSSKMILEFLVERKAELEREELESLRQQVEVAKMTLAGLVEAEEGRKRESEERHRRWKKLWIEDGLLRSTILLSRRAEMSNCLKRIRTCCCCCSSQ